MIRDGLYTMTNVTSPKTALQGAGCPLQSEKSKKLSLNGVITVLFVYPELLYTNPVIINEFDFEKCYLFLKI